MCNDNRPKRVKRTIRPDSSLIRRLKPKRLMADVNPLAFRLIKEGLAEKNITTQSAIVTLLIDYLELPLTIEQATILEELVVPEEVSKDGDQ